MKNSSEVKCHQISVKLHEKKKVEAVCLYLMYKPVRCLIWREILSYFLWQCFLHIYIPFFFVDCGRNQRQWNFLLNQILPKITYLPSSVWAFYSLIPSLNYLPHTLNHSRRFPGGPNSPRTCLNFSYTAEYVNVGRERGEKIWACYSVQVSNINLKNILHFWVVSPSSARTRWATSELSFPRVTSSHVISKRTPNRWEQRERDFQRRQSVVCLQGFV